MPIRAFKTIPRDLIEWSRFFQTTEVTPTDDSVGELQLKNGSVTFQKLQNVQPDRILGRDTTPAGVIQELTVTGGLEFTGSGIQRSALIGDITADAGSNETVLRALVDDDIPASIARDAEVSAAIDALNLASGTYTPTLVAVANIGSASAYPFQYLRVGSVVTVSGRIDADPTADGGATTQVRISLPIATTFASTSNCVGASQSSAISQGAAVFADVTNHDAVLSWFSSTTSSHNMFVMFTYLIT